MNDKKWEYRCTKEKYTAIRHSEQFRHMVTLARIMNSINCSLSPIGKYDSDQSTPEAERQIVGSFMSLGAVLYEALIFTQQLGRHFRRNTVYEAGLGAMLKDDRVRQLRKGLLCKLRNKIVYHYDYPAVDQAIGSIDVDSVVFLRGVGQHTQSLYFQFADEATMHYLMGNPKTEEEFRKRASEFLDSVTEAARRFIRSSNELMNEVLPRLGFEYHESDLPNKAL